MADQITQAPAFCLVLHDVAPSTWRWYADFIAAVDRLGNIPLTLLVVPDFHRHDSLQHHPSFCGDIDRRIARGDEVVLHGYYHDDPNPSGARPKDWFMRRIYTHEGEFYPLDQSQARWRIEQGLKLFAQLGWAVQGFVPPAWLLSDGSRLALQQFDFSYTSDIRGLIRLPEWRSEAAPTLVWSARSAWRRGLSRAWNDLERIRHRKAPLLRLGLHPVDLRHASSRHYWLETVQQLLESRSPVTKSTWLACNG